MGALVNTFLSGYWVKKFKYSIKFVFFNKFSIFSW